MRQVVESVLAVLVIVGAAYLRLKFLESMGAKFVPRTRIQTLFGNGEDDKDSL